MYDNYSASLSYYTVFCGLVKEEYLVIIIGTQHGFSCINIPQVPWEALKTEPKAAVFNTSKGTWRMLMH